MGVLDDIADDAAEITDDLGRTITRTPYGASGGSVSAIVQLEPAAITTTSDGRRVERRGVVFLLPTVTPAADVRDTFTIDARTYSVTGLQHLENFVAFELLNVEDLRIGGTPNRIKR